MAIAIYANFFTHHFTPDLRLIIFAITILMFARCFVFFRVDQSAHSMPFLLAGTLTSFFLWVAENIGTYTHTWRYPGNGWHLVSVQKMGAWGLLLIISFVIVTLIMPPQFPESANSATGYRAWLRGLKFRQNVARKL